VFALLLAAGWRTRLVTVVSWLLLCSLDARNHMVLQSGDAALRMALFWGMFLPLGARWSFDAAVRGQPPARDRVRTVACAALVLQLATIYAAAAVTKLASPVWWHDGLAVYYALHVDQFTTSLGVWLRGHVGLVRALAYLTLAIEIAAPVALLLPWRVAPARLLAAALVIPMHVGLALTMHLGLFSWIVLAWWLAVMPAWFWDRAAALAVRAARPLRGRVDRLAGIARRLRDRDRRRRGELADPSLVVCASRPARAFVGAAVVYCAWWLMSVSPAAAMPRVAQAPGRLLQLDQRWDMFSRPPRTGGWYLAPATLADGHGVDLRTGEPLDAAQPALISDSVGSSRWIEYMTNLERSRRHQRWYLEWLCRRWNHGHGPEEQVGHVDLVEMELPTPLPGRPRPPAKRVVLSSLDCGPDER